MPLLMTIETTNADFVEHWRITNVGHPSRGGHPEDDDLRLYRVQGPDGPFVIRHRRGDGARTLALLALLGPALTAEEIREKHAEHLVDAAAPQTGEVRAVIDRAPPTTPVISCADS